MGEDMGLGRMSVFKQVGRAAVPAVAFAATATPAHAVGEMPSLVHDIGISLFLSGLLAVVLTRLRLPAIAGFIIAGIVAGPLGLGWVTDPANIDTIAQLGFVLLLFMIGLEIDIGKIKSAGRTIVVTGALQFPLTIFFGFALVKLLAFAGVGGVLLEGNLTALYVGAVIAGSSTLIVVKLFQETFELDTVPGRLSLGLLVFQDLWATVVILLQPRLDHPEVMPIIGSFAGIAILAGLAILVSQTLLPHVFRWVAKVPEVVLMAAIGWCFAVVFAGGSLDFTASLVTEGEFHLNVGSGMGALIAGATIASLPYATEIVTKVGVVKDFFVTLFFVGLGLGIPAPSGPGVIVLAVGIAALAIIARQVIFFPLLYWTGTDQRNAEVASVRLAQISEFGLVIAFLGLQYGHISRELTSIIVFAFVLTALTTMPLYHAAYAVHAALKPALKAFGFREPPGSGEADEKQWRLALLGFHRVASSLLYDIAREDPALAADTLVVDFNVALHGRIRDLGAHVEYGDLSNADTLRHAGIESATVIVSTVPDDLMRGTDNRRLVATVRRLNPGAIIIANAVNLSDCDAIYAAGADYVFLSRIEAARGLGDAIGEALNGTLSEYRAAREAETGKPSSRGEALR
jgi:Kef-type K+ transport system membrane component KefB